MLSTSAEHYLTISEASKNIPGRPSVSTIWRWINKGIGANSIKLKSIRVGGKRYTTSEMIDEFLIELNDLDRSHPSTLRKTQIDDAQFQLKQAWTSQGQRDRGRRSRSHPEGGAD